MNQDSVLYFSHSSPRRRSKTPDSSEKMKRNVHFQDEGTLQQSVPGDGSSLSERIGRQDQREIMHSDGKVTLLTFEQQKEIDGEKTLNRIQAVSGTRLCGISYFELAF